MSGNISDNSQLLAALELNAEGCAYWQRELDGVPHPPDIPSLNDVQIRSAFEELVGVAKKLRSLGDRFEEILAMLESDNITAPNLVLEFNGSRLEQRFESHAESIARAPQQAEWERRNPAPEQFVQFSRPNGLRSLLAWDRFTAGLARTPRRIFKRRQEWFGEFEDSTGTLRTLAENDLKRYGPFTITLADLDRRWFSYHPDRTSEYHTRLWHAISGKEDVEEPSQAPS